MGGVRDVNQQHPDATFTYQTDEISVTQWRSVIGVCQAYEKCLLDGTPCR